MRFTTLILRNLLRRPLRSGVTAAGVALAIGAIVAMIGAAEGFRSQFIGMYQSRGVDLIVSRAGTGQSMTAALDERLGEAIARLEGVRDVAPQLSDVISLDEFDIYGVLVQGWPPGSFLFEALRIVEGHMPEAGQRQILVGAVLARNLGKGVGDDLDVVEGETYRIAGVFESFNVFENNSIVMHLDQLQRLMDRPRQVNGFTVRLSGTGDPQLIARLGRQIEALAPGLAAMPASDYVETTHQVMLARSMAWVTSSVVLILGAIGMLNTMVMSVFERTREMGLLRAIGWRKRRIVAMILCEAELLAAAGAVLGIALALMSIWILSQMKQTGGVIEGRISLGVLALGLVVAAGVGVLGGLYPAIRGASMPPTEALRHE